MGSSPSIADLEAKETAFRTYLQSIEADLTARCQTQVTAMQTAISGFYQGNGWDSQEYISGSNADFMQEQDWSLANLQTVINAISDAMFGSGQAPSGVTIESSTEISAALASAEGLEVYLVGKAFEILSGIIESFGAATSVSFSTTTKDEALGNGFHLWATVTQDAYKSQDFFNGSEIYEYLYVYRVMFSEDEAKQQAEIALTELYEDQIAAFKQKVEDLLTQLENSTITPEQYQSESTIYTTLIASAQDQLNKLGPTSAAVAEV